MSDDLRSYSSIASVARTGTVGGTTFNELFIFYYHAITRELRFITSSLGNNNTMKRERWGTVKDANGDVIRANYNETMSPLAATYDPIADRFAVYYSDEQSLIRDVYSVDGGDTWSPGTLANMSMHAIDNHVITAYFDPTTLVTRLVVVDDNMLLHEFKEIGGSSWSQSVVIP